MDDFDKYLKKQLTNPEFKKEWDNSEVEHQMTMTIEALAAASGIKQKVIEEIIALAQKYDVEKVILFGSRARGDYKERSDIDLAFRGGRAAYFTLDVDEETSTLLEFDIVDLSLPISAELLESIDREGIVMYEKVG